MVARRLVFLFPGFEPMPIRLHAERFRRAAERLAGVWGTEIEVGAAPEARPAGEPFLALPVTLTADGRRTETEIVFCDWGDLILAYAARPAYRRLALGARALADFALTGTLLRYFRVSWRYGLFFLYPVVILLAALGAGVLAAALPGLLDLAPVHLLWSLPLGVLVVVALLWRACVRLHLLTLMDDWAFAFDLCRERNPAIADRIEAHRAGIAARMSQTQADEIVVTAHSLGASLAVLALAGALATAARPGRSPHVLTVGSSLMKTALHPAAARQREAVADLVTHHRLLWVDVQALTDPINFYRSNPALSLGIKGGRTPVEQRISLKRLVAPGTYRRIKRDFFRLHRQFVLGAERRNPFSLHMILAGPARLEAFAETGTVEPCFQAMRVAAPGADAAEGLVR